MHIYIAAYIYICAVRDVMQCAARGLVAVACEGGAMLLTEGLLGWDVWRDGCKGFFTRVLPWAASHTNRNLSRT
jgi:hypothetical protein